MKNMSTPDNNKPWKTKEALKKPHHTMLCPALQHAPVVGRPSTAAAAAEPQKTLRCA
jgi:hypothetical protein